jgi:hypothetical protein
MSKMVEAEYIPATVNLTTNPEVATTEAKEAGVQLLKLLDNKPKKVVINGKRHIEFEDWVTLGNFYGVTVKTGEPEPVEIFEAKGFKASAEVIRVDDGIVIGGASAYCLNNEKNWKNKDYFQMASMAQTRAGSKALSNVLRWVVALSGLAGTPAEEMVGINGNNNVKRGVRPNKKTRPDKTPEGVDPNKTEDAQITEKRGGEPSGKKKDKPETMQMPIPTYEKLLKAISGKNKELDQVLKSIVNKEKINKKAIEVQAKNIYAAQGMTEETLTDIKEALEGV